MYYSILELQEYFDSASALVYEAFPKQLHGDYLTKDQKAICQSFIADAASLSLQFSHFVRKEPQLKGQVHISLDAALVITFLYRSVEFVRLLSNCAWYLFEVSDYEICLRVVETGWLACDDKESLEYATLSRIAGEACFELNKLSDCRQHWESVFRIQEKLLQDNSLEVRIRSLP